MSRSLVTAFSHFDHLRHVNHNTVHILQARHRSGCTFHSTMADIGKLLVSKAGYVLR